MPFVFRFRLVPVVGVRVLPAGVAQRQQQALVLVELGLAQLLQAPHDEADGLALVQELLVRVARRAQAEHLGQVLEQVLRVLVDLAREIVVKKKRA